jgi:ribosomal protein S18 acetylase RimI-like enzyme
MGIEIIEYESRYAPEFRKLNLEWLDKYNLTESHDLLVLDNPEATIIKPGGAIYLAKEGEVIVGTAAIIKEHGDEFELAKMAVSPQWQGRGISKLLIAKCLEKAKACGAKKISLFSNHQLTAALSLYEQFGFRHVEVTGSPFATADVKMELVVNE